MAKRSSSSRKRGPQNPGKYPIDVGPNYVYWGEQPGYVYDPWSDSYIPSKQMQEDYAQQQGLAEKQETPPGIWEMGAASAVPTAVSTAGLIGLNELMKPSTATAAATEAAPVVGAVAPTVAYNAIGMTADGGVLLADGSVLAAGSPEAAAAIAQASEAPAVGSGLLGAAGPYLGAAGAALGAYGVYNATQMADKRRAAAAGGLSGAGMGAGLGLAAPLLGFGALGLPALGLLALGGGVLGGGLGAGLAHKTTKQRQAERWQELLNEGIPGTEAYFNQMATSGGNYGGVVDKSQAPDYVGSPGPGQWVNNKFAASRNEADLRPEDIWGSPDVIRAGGPGYFTDWDEEKRRRFAQRLLDEQLIREKQGGIYATDDARAAQLAKEI